MVVDILKKYIKSHYRTQIIDHNMEKWKKKFIILWTGQSISVLTSSVIQMSLVWYLTTKTGSATVMSVAMLMGFVPRAVIGPFAGVLIDRFNKKTVMISSDFFIAGMSMIPVIYGIFDELPVWIIMLTLFCRSLGQAFHTPSLQSVTPLIVPKDSLTQYAGFAQSFETAARLISPAIAAILFNMLSLNVVILFDVFGALFAAFMLGFISINESHDNTDRKQSHFMHELKEGFQIVRTEPLVVVVILISCVYAILYSPIGTYYPLITIEHFQGSINASAIVETVVLIGTLCGAFILGIIGKRINKARAFSTSIAVYGTALIIIGAIPVSWFTMFVCLSAIVGLSTPFYSSVRTALIQSTFDPKYLGRIFTLTISLTSLTTPVGLILAGLFAEKIGVGNWFFFTGIACVALAVISFISTATVRHK